MDREVRLDEVKRVLVVTLLLNLTVCLTKVGLGLATGLVAIVADGLHSLGDTLSNLIGLVGINLAQKGPDEKHGYGYDRFEEVFTLLIVGLISITCFEVVKAGLYRLFNPEQNEISSFTVAVMFASMAINIITIVYEGRAGRRLRSQLLLADMSETKGDLWVSGLVIVSLIIAKYTGWYWLDGLATTLVGLLIARLIWEIIIPTAKQLADAQAVDPQEVSRLVMGVEGVRFCHAIRSRGTTESFYLDLHLGVEPATSVEFAHDKICHKAKEVLKEAFPGLRSALIHLEPDNEAGVARKGSIFRDRDSFGH